MADPTIERLALDFLQQHKDADFIVVSETTGLPVLAEYTTCKGIPRTNKAVYRFPPEWMTEEMFGRSDTDDPGYRVP